MPQVFLQPHEIRGYLACLMLRREWAEMELQELEERPETQQEQAQLKVELREIDDLVKRLTGHLPPDPQEDEPPWGSPQEPPKEGN